MKRIRNVFCIGLIALVLGCWINIRYGSVDIPFSHLLTLDRQEQTILFQIRLPRLCMAILLGGALAVSGFLLQTYFANPIAGPYILGISSGAKMVVAMVMILFLRTGMLSNAMLILAAFAGALISTGFIIVVSHYVDHMASLLIAGIMIGYICNAITDVLINMADDANIINLHAWSQGSFSGMTWDNVVFAAALICVLVAITLLFSKPIGALQLGEGYAQSMGVSIRSFRIVIIVLSSALSACVTAFAGPISFIGIAVPFIMRQSMHTSKPLVLIPASFLGGAIFCIYCDWIARMALSPMELNISTVTSIIGAPIVIYMLVKQRRHAK